MRALRAAASLAMHAAPRLRLWGVALGLASLVHLTLADYRAEAWSPPAAMHAVGAVWLLFTPSLGALALCLIGLLWPLLFLRDVMTQSMLLAWWCAAAIAGTLVQTRRPRHDPRWVLHTAWLLTAGTYFLATFHKVNREFLEPVTSCATHAWTQIAAHWPDLQALDLSGALPTAVLALEGLLTVLVLLRSPAMWPLGLLFHLPLTVTLAPAFGSVMLAGYAAAMTPRDVVRWRRALRGKWRRIAAGGLLGVSLELALRGGGPDAADALRVGFGLALAVWSCLAWGGRWARRPRAGRLPVLIAAAWLFHGFTPYLGLQFQHSAAMLSNLRIDEGCHNSLLVPEAVRLLDPDIRVDEASIGDGQRAMRERVLRTTLWNVPALHTMHLNWCAPAVRPIRLAGTWRGRRFVIDDLCADDWADALDGPVFGPRFLPGYQALQRNLDRRCPSMCVH